MHYVSLAEVLSFDSTDWVSYVSTNYLFLEPYDHPEHTAISWRSP